MIKAKKLMALVLSTVIMTTCTVPVSADIEKTGSIKRGGSGVLSGHYVTTTFEWVINNKKTKVKSSTASQSSKGVYVTSYSVNKKKALSSEKKHVYYVVTKFTFGLNTPWLDIPVTTESYTDKVTLNGGGSAEVDWGI